VKKKFNICIINILVAVVISLVLNGGIFAGHTKGIPLVQEGMGTIKLLGKNNAVPFRDKKAIGRHLYRKHLSGDFMVSTQQKEKN